jgi:hypothetical protein
MSNELPFLKRKLPFLYENFDQIIFVDYNIKTRSNSTDGSLEFIESFDDKDQKKIILIKDFNLNKIKKFRGESFIEKQKMFALASTMIREDMDVVWATDMDEFFKRETILKVEELYLNNKDIVSIDLPHLVFIYNHLNFFNKKDFFIRPRITRYMKKFIYGHCDFHKYGLTIKLEDEYLYHYAFIGFNRIKFKNDIYNLNNKEMEKEYLTSLDNNEKYVKLSHPNSALGLISEIYNGDHPSYLDIEKLCEELNEL